MRQLLSWLNVSIVETKQIAKSLGVTQIYLQFIYGVSNPMQLFFRCTEWVRIVFSHCSEQL